ncbi:hypothetical protein I350_07456 [Cryptococcus amylolentus CBS 6273]|uniref:Dynein light intermediate chain n=1 Tax=Cryptococcus amylolentus CBS 6273 TaxID=1296118 RepID=A0A1E3JH89_9TREE|nr:hypothetical protein I350_07456 [Cryptococcus amylolentus CBS 6273]
MVAPGPSPGPSTPTLNLTNNNRTTSDGNTDGSLWTEILASTDRQQSLGRKNVVLLSERNHGRAHLLSQLTASSRKKKLAKPSQPQTQAAGAAQAGQERRSRKGLALGYEVIEVEEDEDSAPPLSVFYPPSSHPSLLRLVPSALPAKSLSDTAVVIVLDWTKPQSMLQELLTWLSWVETWASEAGERGEVEELHERLQSHLQHYTEPSPANVGTTTYAGVGPLLPLGSGTLTLNASGIPIVVVCTKADLMDNAAEDVGVKGGGWEEKTDRAQQALRTVCLAYGAALFYTAPTQPTTYALLKSYLLHRLYTVPPPLNPPPTSPNTVSAPAIVGSTKFPFNHRANVLDRDAVMVPSGWDSWGKINVLRDGFDPALVEKGWKVSLSRYIAKSAGQEPGEDDGEPLEEFWQALLPSFASPPPQSPANLTTVTEPSQNFLSRQLDLLMKDPNRDPRQSFRHAASATSSSNVPSATNPGAGGFNNTAVGPMGGAAEGLSLPGVEKVMQEMEGRIGEGDDAKEGELKDKFARLGRKDGKAAPGTPAPAMPNEALHNFFQGLLANRGKTGGSAAGTPTKGASAEGAGEGK